MKKMQNELEFQPVIIGADVGAYSIARSFHMQYGVSSVIVCKGRIMPTAYSRIVKPVYVTDLEKTEIILEALDRISSDYADKKLLLIGCGDWYVRIIIENKERLSQRYIVPYIDETLLNEIVLKDKFYAICEELGIPYPKTYVYSPGENEDLQFDFEYPVIAKPANSALYHYAKFEGKSKVFKFKDEAALRAMLTNLRGSSYDYKFLIQDFIPGDDTGMRILTCYSDKNAKVKFMSFGHSLLEEHASGAIGNPVAIYTTVEREIMEHARRFLEHVGFVGFSNFDIKYDPRDGVYKFFEINVRLGRSNFYVTAGGFNYTKYVVEEHVYGKEPEFCIADRENLYCVVPKSILLSYIQDPAIKEKVRSLIKAKQYTNPYIYKKDRGLRRFIAVRMMLLNYYLKFRRNRQWGQGN